MVNVYNTIIFIVVRTYMSLLQTYSLDKIGKLTEIEIEKYLFSAVYKNNPIIQKIYCNWRSGDDSSITGKLFVPLRV